MQITLQIRSLPEEDGSTGVNTVRPRIHPQTPKKLTTLQTLTILPHLLHTALLSLLSASIPLSTTLTSALIALPASPRSASPLVSPTANQILRAGPMRSVHVFAFSGEGRLLLSESEGEFSYAEWEEACEVAEGACCKEEGGVGVSEGMEVGMGERRSVS